MKTLFNNKGNSLAEFAVVIALMATLAATGQVKFSQAGEGGKGKKSANEIEKIAKAGMNFYNQANTDEGAGRFPGQNKWDQNVPYGGGYTGESNAVAVAAANVPAACWLAVVPAAAPEGHQEVSSCPARAPRTPHNRGSHSEQPPTDPPEQANRWPGTSVEVLFETLVVRSPDHARDRLPPHRAWQGPSKDPVH